jgi:hypothetical protein
MPACTALNVYRIYSDLTNVVSNDRAVIQPSAKLRNRPTTNVTGKSHAESH